VLVGLEGEEWAIQIAMEAIKSMALADAESAKQDYDEGGKGGDGVSRAL
jgi:hypothetical protein